MVQTLTSQVETPSGHHALYVIARDLVENSAWQVLEESIFEALKAAVTAEREACAQIAETLKTLNAWLPINSDGEGESEHVTVHGAKIAAEIRKRGVSMTAAEPQDDFEPNANK